jgi:hypothetical protein
VVGQGRRKDRVLRRHTKSTGPTTSHILNTTYLRMSCRPGQPASGRQARRASAEPNRGAAEGGSAGWVRQTIRLRSH